MSDRFHSVQHAGLRKLGTVYFPDFAARPVQNALEELARALTPAERRELHLLLWLAFFCPRVLIRQLFRAEDESTNLRLIRWIGPLHIQIKGLIALLYFAADTQGKPPHE